MYYVVPVSKVKRGMYLKADGGFTCLDEGEIVQVRRDPAGEFFIDCCNTRGEIDVSARSGCKQDHYLDGQEHEDAPYYVGLRRLPWHLWLLDHLAFCLSVRTRKGRV